MTLMKLGPVGFALLLLAGCGGGESTPGQPSAEERRALDNIAAKQDAESQTFDTSADSLVPANEAAIEGNGASPNAGEAAPAAAPNGSAGNGAEAR